MLGSIYLTAETPSSSFNYILSHPKIIVLLPDKKTYFKDAQMMHEVWYVPCPVCHMASGQHLDGHTPLQTIEPHRACSLHECTALFSWHDGFLRCNQQTRTADSASAEGSMFCSSVLFQINLFGYINIWEHLKPWQRYSSLGYISGNSSVVTLNRGQNLVR